MTLEPDEFRPITLPEPAPARDRRSRPLGDAQIRRHGSYVQAETVADAGVVARHAFNSKAQRIAAVDYSIEYARGDGYAGGDVADVYLFDNCSLALSMTDVEGRGIQAAGLAALIKFALRGYASAGMNPETTIGNLNRLYLENCAFEKVESLASVFFAHVDDERRTLGYSSAGHDFAALMCPGESFQLLPPTGPVIGVFSPQPTLFTQRFVELTSGAVLVAVTDGVTESRNPKGEFFGNDRLLKLIDSLHSDSVAQITSGIIESTMRFAQEMRDDIAVLAARFH